MYVYVTLSVIWFLIGFASYFTVRTALKEYMAAKKEVEHKKRALERTLNRLNG